MTMRIKVTVTCPLAALGMLRERRLSLLQVQRVFKNILLLKERIPCLCVGLFLSTFYRLLRSILHMAPPRRWSLNSALKQTLPASAPCSIFLGPFFWLAAFHLF